MNNSIKNLMKKQYTKRYKVEEIIDFAMLY